LIAVPYVYGSCGPVDTVDDGNARYSFVLACDEGVEEVEMKEVAVNGKL
jgi:hypothetical protein